MPVMPDNWIIKMARDHKMIEPFAESQDDRAVCRKPGS